MAQIASQNKADVIVDILSKLFQRIPQILVAIIPQLQKNNFRRKIQRKTKSILES